MKEDAPAQPPGSSLEMLSGNTALPRNTGFATLLYSLLLLLPHCSSL